MPPKYVQREGKPNASGKTTKVWTVVVDAPPDPLTGKRRQTRLTAPTKRELDDKVTAAKHSVKSGTYVTRVGTTVREFLIGADGDGGWLALHKARIRPSTYSSYRSQIELYILPSLGSIALQKLAPGDINALYTKLLDQKRAHTETKLTPRTVRYVGSVLRQALGVALKQGLITRNPADAATPPKSQRPQIDTWSSQQVSMFLSEARKDTYRAAWILEATTGLRRGELLGLRWEDVDLERGRLHIRQTLIEFDKAVHISEPKTAAGRRVVVLTTSAVRELKAHKESQAYRCKDIDTYGDLVFVSSHGTPIRPRNFYRRFREIAEAAKLPPIALHGLRHASATMQLQEGVHPKIVQERLGHSTISLTMDTYSHAIPDMQKDAVDAIERSLSGGDSGAL